MKVMQVTISLIFLLSGCFFGDEAPPTFRIVNETSRDVEIHDDIGGVYYAKSHGGDTSIPMSGCSEYDLEAIRGDDEVVAVLTEQYCHDQTWTITGSNESVIRPDPR